MINKEAVLRKVLRKGDPRSPTFLSPYGIETTLMSYHQRWEKISATDNTEKNPD